MFSDIPPQIDFFDALPDYDLSLYANKKQKTTPASALEALTALELLLKSKRPPRPPPWRPSPPWSCCSRTRAPTTATGMACSTPARLWPSGWSTRTAGCCTPWASPCRLLLSDEGTDYGDRDGLFDACKALAERMEHKNGWLLYPLGIALSGKQRTPGGGVDLACMMGRDKTVQRLRTAIDRLRAAAQE